MKTQKYLVKMLVCCALAASMLGCNPSDENENPAPEGPQPDGEALLASFDENLEAITQEFTLDAADGGIITGEHGTSIMFSPNAFLTESGDPVTGDVDVEFVEIFGKADMLLTEMATKGRRPDGSMETLVSGGEFYINVTQDGEQLKPNGGFTLMVPTDNTGEPDTAMTLFTGVLECSDDDCDVVWEEEEGKNVQIGQRDGAGGGTNGVQTVYYAFQSQFGWSNIDKWYSDPRPKTTIFADVPDGYDNTNCAVYISYDGEPTALAQFDVYDSTTQLFTEHYGLIPIGLEVHFILISIVDDQYYYAIQPATIVANHVEVIGEPQPVSEEDLIDLINDLP